MKKSSHHHQVKHHAKMHAHHAKQAAMHSEKMHNAMAKVGTVSEEKKMARKGDKKGSRYP